MSFYFAVLMNSVLLSGTGKSGWSATFAMVGQLFFILFCVVLVLVMAAFSTKYMAGARYMRHGKSNLKTLEGLGVGLQANVQLIKAGEKYFLIGVTKERITYLAEIPKEEIVEADEPLMPKIPFEKYLNDYFKHKDKNQDEDNTAG